MSEHAPHAFRVEPATVTKVWGGRTIVEQFGRDAPADEPVGESWEVADLPEGESRVATGPLRGRPLSDLVERWGRDLVGDRDPSEGFPLLVKIIDAAEDLSVQVHPSQRDVEERFPEADSKDESWLILRTDPGGSILHGVREGVTAETFRRAVDEGRAAELLRRVEVEPGDVVRVAPGTIHAICAGVTLLEIQQPSDTTYRLYDYDRPGLDGQPRELHLDRGMQVANFGDQPPTRIPGGQLQDERADIDLLVDVDAYRIERVEFDDDFEWIVHPGSPQVVHVLEGSLVLTAGEAASSVRIEAGRTAVVPASVERASARAEGPTPAQSVVAGLGGVPLVS